VRTLARIVLALQLGAVALFGLNQVAASAQPSPSASPSPADSAAEPSPAASSSTAPSPRPPAGSASPSPSPSEVELSPGPSETAGPSPRPTASGTPALTVSGRSLEIVAQVGDRVHYEVTVSNPGPVALDGVFVVDLLPAEVDFVSANLLPEVEATLYNRIGTKASITWNVGELAPGQTLTLGWTGTATSAGDMNALNSVRAVARGARRVRQESSTFLATTSTLGGTNPTPSPTTTTIVSYERVPTGEALGAPESEAGRALPVTGFDGRLAVAVAGLLTGLGVLLWWMAAPGPRRRRRVCLALAAMALLAACTSGRDGERVALDPSVSPEVKGRQIGPDGTVRNLGGDGDGDRAGEDEEEETDDGDATADGGPGATPPPPVAAQDPPGPPPTGPLTRLVRQTRVVTIDPVLAAPVRLASRRGDNAVSYGWSGVAVTSEASSPLPGGSSPVRIETSVTHSGGVVAVVVVLTNESARTPVVVDGRVHHDIASSGGRLAALTSAPLDVVLQPGGTTATSFTYDLPSGSYSATAAFRSK
jgi:uncharacterized repeat protein (TIGR01451 family)